MFPGLCFIVIVGYVSRVMFYCNCRIRFPGYVIVIVGYVSRVMFYCNCRIRFPCYVLL